MAFSLKPGERSVGHGVRRIALDQLDTAIESLDDTAGDIHERIHDARKRCKKLRGLLRLVRPALADYGDENKALRDAARRLSGLRDLTAFLETYDRLTAQHGDALDLRRTGAIRAELTRARQAAEAGSDLADGAAAMAGDLREIRARVQDWRLSADGFEAIGPGLGKTYARARVAMATARETGRPEDLHAWRKRVKYHWYHTRILRRVFPPMMAAHRDAADQLGERLGQVQDVVGFEARLAESGADPDTAAALAALARAERDRLAAEAFEFGAYLLAEKPKPLVKRWGSWWELSRR